VRRLLPGEVASALDEPATADLTLTWVVDGWPEDVDRAIASFRATAGDRRVQYVVADLTGAATDRWGAGVEVVPLREGTGWAAARNAGLRRARGSIVIALDGSIEAGGDVIGPLEDALADPTVGVCGPFGIVTDDLRKFHRVRAPAECDAVEGYLMAFRREMIGPVGGFDERFTWYRTADIEWSFRVRAAGLRALAVPVPVTTHAHRAWEALDRDERDRRSRRNYARFLDRWRDRWDLTVRGRPPDVR
jgi:cysteinyl-tRNA synthetase